MMNAPTQPIRTRPRVSRAAFALSGAAAVLVVVMLVAVGNGTLDIAPMTTIRAVWHGATGQPLEGLELIVWNIRLPRVVFGALVGASLAACGAAMQGLFRNPLADPYLTGVASGAALGATVAIFVVGTPAAAFAASIVAGGSSSLVPIFAFLGALAGVTLTVWLSGAARQSGTNALILAGVIVGAMLTAITTYIQLRDADRMRAVFSWTLGNLALAGWSEVLTVLPFALIGFVALLALSRALDALQLGEDTAQTLGLKLVWVKLGVVIASSLIAAAAVAFAGIIGFVGLVAPHAMRRLGRPNHRWLIPASALAGASLLVLSDLLARTLTRPAELPVGVVTTLIGGPFFLWLLRRRG